MIKKGGTMDRDTIFLYVIAAIALCFGLINCIQYLHNLNNHHYIFEKHGH